MLDFKSSKTLPALGSIKFKLKSLADNTYFVASATEMIHPIGYRQYYR
jgi:hypothetical protein